MGSSSPVESSYSRPRPRASECGRPTIDMQERLFMFRTPQSCLALISQPSSDQSLKSQYPPIYYLSKAMQKNKCHRRREMINAADEHRPKQPRRPGEARSRVPRLMDANAWLHAAACNKHRLISEGLFCRSGFLAEANGRAPTVLSIQVRLTSGHKQRHATIHNG